ncbi:MAG: hypothetical protein SH848_12775 [Saprospiraceae bacterium]|nr:hypothetical protein [Saprospiraceae bacterium]MDZ4704801.1 hypothetical protein [Saprospiraceae bacterium]
MRKLSGILFIVLLWWGCNKDERERLFEMVFPNTLFTIPAGANPSFPLVFEVNRQNTNIDFFLSQSGTDTAAITAINAAFGTLTALENGKEYYFIEEISVRICDTERAECSPADEVFYINELRGQADDRIRLLPSLRNVKKIMTGAQFKLEVVFFLNDFSPYTVESRLDMTFDALK